MTTRLAIAATLIAGFVLLATANSGGYRYGVSDQAYHVPALARLLDPSLFPRDAAVLDAQSSLTVGDDLMVSLIDTPAELPRLMAALQIATLALLAAAGAFLSRGLGASAWTAAGALALLTIRHRIAGTGANSLEGYMNPRMLAFAIGLLALGLVLRRRWTLAAVLVVIAGLFHPTTGVWCGSAAVIAWAAGRDRRLVWAALGLGVAAGLALLAFAPRMDAEWLEVLAGKDYLFATQWPAYAWATNLLYPVVLWAVYRRRARRGLARSGEAPLLVGLSVLVAGFLVSVPLASAHVAVAVQLQVNRVFWVLDAVTMVYLAWWVVDDLAGRHGRRMQTAAVALLVLLSAARGTFVLADTNRALARPTLEQTDWTDALAWIGRQPDARHVLADPGHAWKFGPSVRVGALRDTVLELGKDSALAMYDRRVARRVRDRMHALGAFDSFTTTDFVALAGRYDADVLIVERSRLIDLPLLYANDGFAVYRLR